MRELVIQDKAGERILEGLVEDAQSRLRDDGVEGEIFVFKNNTDSAGNSYGCHENYLYGRSGDFSASPTCSSPSSSAARSSAAQARSWPPPTVRVRRQPARRPHLGGRLLRHEVSARSSTPATSRTPTPRSTAACTSSSATRTCSETTTLLKVGSADLVLRMIEAGIVMRDLTMENPIRAIRTMSHDTDRAAPRCAWPTAASSPPSTCSASTSTRPSTSSTTRAWAAPTPSRCSTSGAAPSTPSGRRPRRHRHRDRLGHQVPPHRALPGPPRPLALRRAGLQLDLAYHDINRSRGLFYLLQKHGRPPGSPPTWRCSRPRCAHRRPPAPSCAATSSGRPRPTAATSPSTGCTSSSTTRRSAPCSARTRSAPSTTGSTGSWSRSSARPACSGPSDGARSVEGLHTASHSRSDRADLGELSGGARGLE